MRYGIVGDDPVLLQAIDTAVQVAPTQLSVLVLGENGSGKEVFSRIVHDASPRKHNAHVAVNCGAIPEGTIDSELFGHEKGAFTGAVGERRGYFEEANGGTIFLDEIGELPLGTQAKLLRVLEKGEFMRVGSSDVRKTEVRVVAATNVDLLGAIADGRFREDLYYRLNGITLRVPPLRRRVGDIPALFHKFTSDFAQKNGMPTIRLTASAREVLMAYTWPGNVRQLRNVAEQVTVLARQREVDEAEIRRFVPIEDVRTPDGPMLPQVDGAHNQSFNSDRELLYKVLFDLRNDVNDLKKLVLNLLHGGQPVSDEDVRLLKRLYPSVPDVAESTLSPSVSHGVTQVSGPVADDASSAFDHLGVSSLRRHVEDADMVDGAVTQNGAVVEADAPSSLADNERELIRRALLKHGGSRRKAARELQISERTLYRKIDTYGLDV